MVHSVSMNRIRKNNWFSIGFLIVFLAFAATPVLAQTTQSVKKVQDTQASNKESGAEVLRKLSDNLFDSREVKFNARFTIANETTLNDGLFFAAKESGYLSLTGISEYQYDKENIFFYNIATNELTIQKRKAGSANVFENPFGVFNTRDGVSVSDPSLEVLDGKRVKVLTLTPKGKANFKSAKIYLKEDLSVPQLIRLDIIPKTKGGKCEITVTSFSSKLSPERAAGYKIDVSARKGVKINDLR